MLKHIHHIRSKSLAHRQMYTFAISLGITIIIFLGWVVSLASRFGSGELPGSISTSASTSASSFSKLQDQLANSYDATFQGGQAVVPSGSADGNNTASYATPSADGQATTDSNTLVQ